MMRRERAARDRLQALGIDPSPLELYDGTRYEDTHGMDLDDHEEREQDFHWQLLMRGETAQ